MPGSAPPPRPDSALDEDTRVRLTEEIVAAVATALALDAASVRTRASEAIAAILTEYVRETDARLLRTERLASIGQLSAAVAHELRNPLSVIETSAFIVAERGRADERIARHTKRIADQVALAGGVVSDMLEAARDRPLVPLPIDLNAVARAAVAQIACPAGAVVKLELPGQLPPASADERRIRQVITNLIANALDATNAVGVVTVSTRATEHSVMLAVCDDGPGIPEQHVKRLFEPLFTTKSHGTGLGLALSRQIARAHGGDLVASNRTGARGARFELILPRSTQGTIATEGPRT